MTFLLETVTTPSVRNPCQPSPCGPNSVCRENNGQAVCSCLPEFRGSPPGCRPECVVSAECPPDRVCVNQKCTDPCPDPCGRGAICRVINRSPICTCQQGYTGDAFTICFPLPRSYSIQRFISRQTGLKFLVIISIPFYRSTIGACNTCATGSLFTISLWPVLSVSKYRRKSLLLLFALLYRCTTKL